MKALWIIVWMMSVSLYGYSQTEMTVPQQPIPSTQPESVIKLKDLPNPYPHQYNQNLEDMCLRYRGIRNGGIVLSSIGAGLIVTGAALLPHINHTSGESTEYIQHVNTRQRTAAKAAIAIGALTMTAGIPMITFGAIKARRACGLPPRHPASLRLQTGQDGAGIGLKF